MTREVKRSVGNPELKMAELTGNSYFRSTKCKHNDKGYCKFENKCRKTHAVNVCIEKKCDKNCNSRHPIPCKYRSKCKFLAKKICAFSHIKSNFGDESDDCDSDIVDLKKQVESLKQGNESKQMELETIEREIKTLKEMKIVVTALIKDVEEKAEQISNLEKETSNLKNEIDTIKEESKINLNNLAERFSKDFKEMKLAVTALIVDVEKTKNNKLDCNKSHVEETCENGRMVQNAKTHLEKHKEGMKANMSNFRFDFSRQSTSKQNM